MLGGTGKRGDRVPGLLDVSFAHPSKSRLVSSERTRRHEGAAPRHPCYSATRRCVIVEAARAGLIWDTFEVWRIFASAREFKPTLLREMGFFNLRPIYISSLFSVWIYMFSFSIAVKVKSDFSENILETVHFVFISFYFRRLHFLFITNKN